MTPIFRILLIVVSLLTTYYILKRIRQSKLQIEYAIFWILFSGVLIVFSLFPWLVSMFTRMIGMQLPVNFIFMLFIFVLMVKLFLMTIELSTLENKVKDLTQELALEEKERRDEQKRLLEETGAQEESCKMENKEGDLYEKDYDHRLQRPAWTGSQSAICGEHGVRAGQYGCGRA